MINKSPLFSIIVPAFDVEEQIEKCLNSVFTQIFRDFELIVIDDGSTDRTQEKILSLMNLFPGQLKLIIQKNRGVSAARNKGISLASGQFILFLDGDDYLSNRHLLNLSKILPTDSFISIFNKINILQNNSVRPTRIGKKMSQSVISIDQAIEFCLDDQSFRGWPVNKVFSRDIILKHQVQFNEQIHQREDRLFCVEYFLAAKLEDPDKKILIIDQPTYYYVMRDSSQTHQVNEKTFSLLQAQALINQKTNHLSSRVDQLNRVKSINDVCYCYLYGKKLKINNQLMDQIISNLLSDFWSNLLFLTIKSGQTIRNRVRLSLLFLKIWRLEKTK